jgi:uncharacterized protein
MSQQFNPVAWFEIYVDDIARAKQFYSKVLAVDLYDMDVPNDGDGDVEFQMVSFPLVEEAPNASGALVKAQGVKAGGNSTMVYFSCEDCSVEEGRVEGAGGKVIKPKFPIGPYGFCAVNLDTEGNMFGLHSMQ